jgi:hypothetical protein
MLLFAAPPDSKNLVVQIIHNNPTYALWLKISIALGAPFCGILLAAGIGLLQLKPWARSASIAYAIYTIIMVLVGNLANYFFLIRPLLEMAHQQHDSTAQVALAGAIGGLLGSCFGLIYPIFLLIFMLRPNVIAALKPPTVI